MNQAVEYTEIEEDIEVAAPAFASVRKNRYGSVPGLDDDEFADPEELERIGYCESLAKQPTETILVLISDLFEGGVEAELLKRAAALTAAGVQLIILLALSDEGAPSFDHTIAAKLSALSVPSFACSPDRFPDLMATAISRGDIRQWAAGEGIVSTASRHT